MAKKQFPPKKRTKAPGSGMKTGQKKKPAPQPPEDAPPKVRKRVGGGNWHPRKIKRFPTEKITPELVEQICGLIQVGNYLSIAATVSGISLQTLKNWLKKGHEILKEEGHDRLSPEKWIYADFALQVKHAHALSEVRDTERMDIMIEAGDSSLLKHKMSILYGERWKKKKEVEHTHEVSGQVQNVHTILSVADLEELPVETLKQLLAAIRKKQGVLSNGQDSGSQRDAEFQRLLPAQEEARQDPVQVQGNRNGDGEREDGSTGRKVGLRELPPGEDSEEVPP